MAEQEDWLLNLSALESVNPDEIRKILKNLPINKNIKLPSWFSRLRKHSYLKNLEDSVSIIIKFYAKETKDYIKEMGSVPYLLDFVVHKMEGEDLADYIHFNVRLYHKTKSGNIFYGLQVARIEKDKFVLIH